jgi:hypothetical protein
MTGADPLIRMVGIVMNAVRRTRNRLRGSVRHARRLPGHFSPALLSSRVSHPRRHCAGGPGESRTRVRYSFPSSHPRACPPARASAVPSAGTVYRSIASRITTNCRDPCYPATLAGFLAGFAYAKAIAGMPALCPPSPRALATFRPMPRPKARILFLRFTVVLWFARTLCSPTPSIPFQAHVAATGHPLATHPVSGPGQSLVRCVATWLPGQDSNLRVVRCGSTN